MYGKRHTHTTPLNYLSLLCTCTFSLSTTSLLSAPSGPCWKPYSSLLLIYVIIRFYAEIVNNATADITERAFQWNVTDIGLFLSLIAFILLPVHIAFGGIRVSYIHDYRHELVISLACIFICAGFSCLLYLFQQSYNNSSLYITGAIIVMASTQVIIRNKFK